MQDGLTAMPANTILYLHMIESDSCQHAKLAGIRRYAAARGWQAEAYGRFRSRARMVPGILARERPIGCIVEGAGRWDDLPPALFGRTSVRMENGEILLYNASNLFIYRTSGKQKLKVTYEKEVKRWSILCS